MSNALDDLIAAVDAGTFRWNAWAEPALDRALMAKVEDAYHGSLDAALALHNAVLPEWSWGVGGKDRMGGDPRAFLYPPDGPPVSVYGETPARSWLSAILRAMREGKDA